MKILYMTLTICLFLYADNFEHKELVEINQPFFKIEEMYRDNQQKTKIK
ncbi:hypothetical protein [Helicobacter sp.]|nr:hypothetical protein [Helicobacter sp.]MBD5165205.1 hypothetical protein [Helicobacter sp.]